VPRLLHSRLLRHTATSAFWRRIVRDEQPDVVFNMGNYAVPVSVPQVTLFHWPYAIYPDRDVWRRMGWPDWIRRRLRCVFLRRQLPFTSVMVAQTQTAARRLRQLYGINGRLEPLPALGPRDSRTRLLCFTRYYSHKNIEVLLPVAKQLKDANAPFQIILTFAHDQNGRAKAIMEGIRRQGLDDYIQNIGPVDMQDVPRLYASVDALLLPTLLESFSQTYVEAMHFGKPIFTSDRDFAHDVCGDVAFFFDPHDPDDIVHTVTEAYRDRDALAVRIQRGKQRVAAMPDWHTVTGMLMDILHAVRHGHCSEQG
jgi:glycosyltransferase involved in cell wall biosynthesis